LEVVLYSTREESRYFLKGRRDDASRLRESKCVQFTAERDVAARKDSFAIFLLSVFGRKRFIHIYYFLVVESRSSSTYLVHH
jgi:hypothetical protein